MIAIDSFDTSHPLLFEVAWEVCNKVGGIYTVLKSKTPVTSSEFGQRMCLIGPLAEQSLMEIEECEPPTKCLKEALKAMDGVRYVFGRWLVEGAPFVLLLDLAHSFNRLDEWKRDLWYVAGVPAPQDDHETNQAVVFGYLVAWFLQEFLTAQKTFESRTLKDIEALDPNIQKPVVIVHFHEWLAGVALLLIRKRNLELVF
jgi:glycogen(starch) synthase